MRHLLLLLLLPLTIARADTPPAAKEAIQRGLDELAKQDYKTAAESFADAHEKGGPGVYYDIGLAESQIPGRELRAICWFGAYLAANPNAANAKDVKQKIDALRAKNREKVIHLIQSLQETVLKMPEGENREYAMRAVPGVWTDFGDFDAAKKMIALIKYDNTRSDALNNLACAYSQLTYHQVEAGDMPAALASAAEAQKAVDAIPNPNTQGEARYYTATPWVAIARGQLRAGDLKALPDTIGTIERLCDPIKDYSFRNDLWRDIAAIHIAMARAQFKAGDADAAKKSIAASIAASEHMSRAPWPWTMEALQDTAEAQILTGDKAGARESLAAAAQVARDAHGLRAIAWAQVRADDVEGAKKTAGLVTDANAKAGILAEIAAPPKNSMDATPPFMLFLPSDQMTIGTAKAGDDDWLNMVDEGFSAPRFTARPDFADYKAIAAEIEKEPHEGMAVEFDPNDTEYALTVTTRDMVRAHTAVEGMLKLQFGK